MKLGYRLCALILLSVFAVTSAFAVDLFVQSPLYPQDMDYSFVSQLGIGEFSLNVPESPVLQALGDSSYPVTPGDTYKLAYYDGKNLVTLDLQADTDCNVAIQSLGVVKAAGMTYCQFKEYVENLISSYYSFSSPQLVLTGCGVFSVRVTGEVLYSQYVTCWGLTRLSDLAGFANQCASTRDVTIVYKDGSRKSFDLFNGLRNGNAADNPLLAPGCEVIFNQAKTTVVLSGAVKKMGVYQTKGESLKSLITDYGCGFATNADQSSITVANYQNGTYIAKTMSFDECDSYIPADGDSITVSFATQAMPFVTVTGAVASTGTGLTTSAGKLLYSFLPGETVEQLLRNVSALLLPTSDVSTVYVLRDGNKISVDGSSALTGEGKGTIELQLGDTVVIPFSQLFVTVNGSVNAPGSYPYVPDRTADYYINLAGGYSANANMNHKISIFDKDGNKLKSVQYVAPESTITAERDNLTVNIALASSILAIITSLLNIIIYTHTISTY